MRTRLAFAATVSFLLLWSLWAMPALNRGGPLLSVTRDFVKDLSPIIAVVVASLVLTRRAREVLQVRAALLPVIYDQAKQSWMQISIRAKKLATYYDDAAHVANAAERCFY